MLAPLEVAMEVSEVDLVDKAQVDLVEEDSVEVDMMVVTVVLVADLEEDREDLVEDMEEAVVDLEVEASVAPEVMVRSIINFLL